MSDNISTPETVISQTADNAPNFVVPSPSELSENVSAERSEARNSAQAFSVLKPSEKPSETNKLAQQPIAEEQTHTLVQAEKSVSQLGQLKIAIAQMPSMVGDVASNLKRMKLAAKDARQNGVDILVFGEMALVGYPCGDILKNPAIGERIKAALASLAEDSKEMVILVGYPHIDHYGTFNSVAILQGGVQKGFYHKQSLQDDGLFHESAYFNAGLNQVIFDYKGVSIGLLIGKDIAKKQPIKALKESGAELIININASPFCQDKQEQRKQALSAKAKSVGLPIVYVNAVGSQERTVFDGGSMIVNKDGKIMHEAARFFGQFLFANYDHQTGLFDEQTKLPLVLSQDAELYQALVVGLRDYVNRSGFKAVIVGLSGGLDSALTLCIAVDALGADKVYAVMMPYQYTSAMSVEDAEAQAKRLGVSYSVCPIFEAMAGFKETLAPILTDNGSVGTTEENLQARIRGTILMALSNKYGHLVLNTSNKSESAVGYGTLYGDLVGGFGVLADVYKTDVYRLANYRNRLEDDPVIPERVISRPPSAELRPNQTDQDNLPDYEVLDNILRLYIEQNKSFEDIVKAGVDEQLALRVLKMVDKNEYKRRQAPFGAKVSVRSFGERTYPIVNGWQHKIE